MPFLRFTRDKRGYETTSLVHTARHGGRSRQHILYWFRTPPGVRVGRPALDQDAIRWIEEHNPDIEFDWPKILEAKPPAAAPATAKGSRPDEGRSRRGRRDRQRPADGVRPPAPPRRQRGPEPEPEPLEQERPQLPEPELLEPEPSEPEPLEPESWEQEPSEPESLEPEPLEPEPLELEPLAALAFEQLTHPEAEEKIDPPSMPIEHVAVEQLTRLRARYAELLARIAERGGNPDRVEALRSQAESLNPDTWVTDEEVRQGIESFEPKIRDLRAALGLRRRRRSRRGGRRRQGGGGTGGGTPPAEDTGNSSNENG